MKILDIPQSGSVNGVTSSRNRFGQYRRTKAIPVNPQTTRQTQVRDTFGDLASQWGTLTPTQRASWETCALEFPKVDSLGQAIVLSGFNMFVRANSALVDIGEAVLLTPVASTAWVTATVVPTAAAGTPALSIAYVAPAAGHFLRVDAGPMVSAGRSYGDTFALLFFVDDTGVSPQNALAAYVARWGALIAGQRIFVRARALNQCGVFGPEYVTSVVVAA